MVVLRWVLSLIIASFTAPLFALDKLEIPADALVVVQSVGQKPMVEALTKFLNGIDEKAVKALPKHVEEMLKAASPERDFSALTPNAKIVLLTFTFEGVQSINPPWVWLVPVPDYKTFQHKILTTEERRDLESSKQGYDRAGSLCLVPMPKSGYVAVTQHEPSALKLAQGYAPLKPEELGTLGPILETSDVSLQVNLQQVEKDYGDVLRGYLSLAKLLLANGGSGLVPAFDPRQVETVQFLLNNLQQALAEGQRLALGMNISEGGIVLRTEVQFLPKSAITKVLQPERPSTLESLGRLPSAQPSFSASQMTPASLGFFRALNREYRAHKDEDRAVAAIEGYEKLMVKLGESVRIAKGDQSAWLAAAPDAVALTAAHAKVLRTLPDSGWYRNLKLRESPSLTENALTAHGFTLHRGTLRLDLEAGVATIRDVNLKQATLESIKRLVNETTTIWFGHDGKQYVQLEAKTAEEATAVLLELTQPKKSIAEDALYQTLRKQLPPTASLIAIYEAEPTLRLLADYAQSVSGALPAVPGFEVPEFQAVKNAPLSYFGYALTLGQGRIGLQLVIPTATAKIAKESIAIPTP